MKTTGSLNLMRKFSWSAILGVCLTLTTLMVTGAGNVCAEIASQDSVEQAQPSQITQGSDWGIEIVALRRSAANYMLDLRYRVVDSEKAGKFLSDETKPYLLHQATGSVLTVPTTPKVGDLRQTTRQPLPGRVYFVLFSNPGAFVKPGDLVTLVDGDQKLENLVVD